MDPPWDCDQIHSTGDKTRQGKAIDLSHRAVLADGLGLRSRFLKTKFCMFLFHSYISTEFVHLIASGKAPD